MLGASVMAAAPLKLIMHSMRPASPLAGRSPHHGHQSIPKVQRILHQPHERECKDLCLFHVPIAPLLGANPMIHEPRCQDAGDRRVLS